MRQKPMIIFSKHSVTLSPELPDKLVRYVKYCLEAVRTKRDEYLQARSQQPSEDTAQDDPVLAYTQQKIDEAEAFIAELEQLKAHHNPLYERDFYAWADAVIKTLIALGITRIDEFQWVEVLIDNVEAALKENPYFSSKKFRGYISSKIGGEQQHEFTHRRITGHTPAPVRDRIR
jgi:hypothetical protein